MSKEKYLYFPYKKFRNIGIGTLLINFLFQKIFRINGKNYFMIHYTSRFNSYKGLKINFIENEYSLFECFASSGSVYLNAYNGIEISSDAILASGVKLISVNHNFEDYSKKNSDLPIRIESRVWLGTNSIILPGVTIGRNSIIGAGSVVTKSIPPNVIAAGNPARVIRYQKNNL